MPRRPAVALVVSEDSDFVECEVECCMMVLLTINLKAGAVSPSFVVVSLIRDSRILFCTGKIMSARREL
jgi:hypothetical protein